LERMPTDDRNNVRSALREQGECGPQSPPADETPRAGDVR
jgi:hypothetical protein